MWWDSLPAGTDLGACETARWLHATSQQHVSTRWRAGAGTCSPECTSGKKSWVRSEDSKVGAVGREEVSGRSWLGSPGFKPQCHLTRLHGCDQGTSPLFEPVSLSADGRIKGNNPPATLAPCSERHRGYQSQKESTEKYRAAARGVPTRGAMKTPGRSGWRTI